jgi:stage II sporulation protein D
MVAPMRTSLLAVAAALLLAAPSVAGVTVTGHGFGHGVGLSQYGAYGYALRTSDSYATILQHYYPGTELRIAPSQSIRVHLKDGPALLVGQARRLSAPGRRAITLRPERTYRISRDGATLTVIDRTTGRARAHVTAPASFAGAGGVLLRGRAENGVTTGRYRGQITILTAPTGLTAINRLGLESYLRGVVPAEMPASWPAEALRAQAVAARSYALRSLRPAAAWDVEADTRSQQYAGLGGEDPRATKAVRDTARRALYYGDKVAATYFNSSSGGRTATAQEAFGGPAVPYLISVEDPYDDLSPAHDWTVSLTVAQAAKKLGALVQGDLQDLVVTARTPSGRAAVIEVRGSTGTLPITAAQLQLVLGLRSTWFDVTLTPDPTR